MPEPRTVWMARPGKPEPVEGILAMARDGLSFTPLEGEGVSVLPAEVRRARRFRGSPVLEVDYERRGEAKEAFFFFAPPPPLAANPRPSPLSTKGLRRAGGILALRAQSKALKPVLTEWVRALRALQRG